MKRSDSPQQALFPETSEIFFRKGREGRVLFRHSEDSKVDANHHSP